MGGLCLIYISDSSSSVLGNSVLAVIHIVYRKINTLFKMLIIDVRRREVYFFALGGHISGDAVGNMRCTIDQEAAEARYR